MSHRELEIEVNMWPYYLDPFVGHDLLFVCPGLPHKLQVGGALFSGVGPLSPLLAIDTSLVLVLLTDPRPLPNGTSAHSKNPHCSF